MEAERTLPTCYRHPDRETRLGCSACGRPACVECVQPTDVGQKCQECTRPDPGARVITADQLRTGGRSSPVSHAVLGACAIVFVLGFVDPGVRTTLFELGAQLNTRVAAGEWWRVLTAGFLHANLTHILFNMWALYLFGPPLEREAGSVPFAALYVASMLAGSAAYYLGGAPNPAVGASGAIFGLFGAWLAAALRNRHTSAGQAGLRQLLLLLGINLALPFVMPGIAWEAHLGGLAAGFGIVLAWGMLAGRRTTPLLRTLAAVVVAVASAGVILVL